MVVAYDMPEQIVRTVRSLSPPMQRDVDAAEYEVVVVDNGSRRPIDRTACEAFGARVRWLAAERPTPSPAAAVNLGIRSASATLVGAMVDGARLASPGLVSAALEAAARAPRPIVATLGLHLGHEPQQLAVAGGYDERAERELLESVDWTADGYRLFEISSFGKSARDGWYELPVESNAVFMPATMWAELGGFDEAFTSPGGGLVNLDLFRRACQLPRSELFILVGEATFHQFHGGVSTNTTESRWEEFHAEYVRVRGEPYEKPAVRPTFVGTPPTTRTR